MKVILGVSKTQQSFNKIPPINLCRLNQDVEILRQSINSNSRSQKCKGDWAYLLRNCKAFQYLIHHIRPGKISVDIPQFDVVGRILGRKNQTTSAIHTSIPTCLLDENMRMVVQYKQVLDEDFRSVRTRSLPPACELRYIQCCAPTFCFLFSVT